MHSTKLRSVFLGSVATISSFIAFSALEANAATMTLAWDPSGGAAAGYKVHCGEAAKTYSTHTDVGNVNTIIVDGLVDGTTYYCAVTAYDSARADSAYSNEVSKTIPSAAPVVGFSATPTTGTAPASVTFSNTTTGTVSTWSWSFGDGTYSTAKTPTHTYSTAGDYRVTLTATGPGGSASMTLATAIHVTAPTTTTSTSTTGTTTTGTTSTGTTSTGTTSTGTTSTGTTSTGTTSTGTTTTDTTTTTTTTDTTKAKRGKRWRSVEDVRLRRKYRNHNHYYQR